MKKESISIGTTLLFLATGCSTTNHSVTNSKLINNIKIIASNSEGEGKGGNPEVKELSICFRMKNKARESCFNKIYPGKINIFAYPNNGKTVKLAGRKSAVERRIFNLAEQKSFIINIDVSKVQFPITCNIKSAKYWLENNIITIDIPVKDIAESVTISDNMDRVLLDYKIDK